MGRLQPIASKVLMKIGWLVGTSCGLHKASPVGLRSGVRTVTQHCTDLSATSILRLTSGCRVHIGDRINECKLWLISDADWSGEHDRKSTSGCALYLVGPNTYYPLNAFSKKQTSVTMSSTESEVISANHGVRTRGLPRLSLWMFLWQQVEIDPANHQVRPKRPPPVKIDGVLARIDRELDEIRY